MTMISTEHGPQVAIDQDALDQFLDQIAQTWVLDAGVERLLVLPPDHTRLHSRAGDITSALWQRLHDQIYVDVMPTLGTHKAMTKEECELMFGSIIPFERILPHRWREDLQQVGEISADEMSELSAGRFAESMNVEVNSRLVTDQYDLVLSVGQVVPHEVIGLANYTKNVCIGAGGKDMIHKSHFLGAVCGMESIMGQRDTPVRSVIDRAYEKYVRPKCDVGFILTVIGQSTEGMALHGVFGGHDRDCYEAAAALSQEVNIKRVEPLHRCVVTLDAEEYKSTWLGNKAIYRTRMAMANDSELIVLAPGVERFGEDTQIDQLVRQFGYKGTPATLAAVAEEESLRNNLSAAAHLIHGSSEGRFQVTYCPGPKLSKEEVNQVGFEYQSYPDAAAKFQAESREEGWHEDADGKPFYLIRHPGLGLWTSA